MKIGSMATVIIVAILAFLVGQKYPTLFKSVM